MQPNKVRMAALFYPAPGISYEQFSRYWLMEHGKHFMSLDIVKKNLTKYEQFHFNNELNSKVCEGMQTEATPFWGMAVFEAESYEEILEVFSHPDYIRIVFPDECKILDRGKCQLVTGKFATLYQAKL